LREYSRYFAVTTERLEQVGDKVLVMHPGPMNEGVEITPEAARSAQSVIEEQVTNGVAVRMALLYTLAA
jgi:aspartate carbamoyltransferase catalytic subunit